MKKVFCLPFNLLRYSSKQCDKLLNNVIMRSPFRMRWNSKMNKHIILKALCLILGAIIYERCQSDWQWISRVVVKAKENKEMKNSTFSGMMKGRNTSKYSEQSKLGRWKWFFKPRVLIPPLDVYFYPHPWLWLLSLTDYYLKDEYTHNKDDFGIIRNKDSCREPGLNHRLAL